ncbi:MAG TPA: hypothetical protein VE954_24425 [Oligoflexus sp.]|uniref:hypothetical protein n=1 Tax=Oligoflexus sp. TaxID=1971216 RepID=UPI002D53EA05|nr:hypothetical protein [Oligoflexus sp.]HYX36262.1 hypothetical protein [Oligoflexus sp.]
MNCPKTSIAVLMLCISLVGCSKGSKDKREDSPNVVDDQATLLPLKQQILDYSNFEAGSFESLSWEKKCSGIANFLQDFTKSYLASDVSLNFDLTDCFFYNSTSDRVVFQPKFTLSNNGNERNITVTINAKFDTETYKLSVKNVNLQTDFSESEISTFGENLVHLKETFTDWAMKTTDGQTLVFGLSYVEYASKFETQYGPESPGLKIEKKPMTFQLLPTPNRLGRGTIRFMNVDPGIFSTTGSDGNPIPTPYLGCLSIECLNSNVISYELIGIDLVLSTPSVTSGSIVSSQISIFRFESFE